VLSCDNFVTNQCEKTLLKVLCGKPSHVLCAYAREKTSYTREHAGFLLNVVETNNLLMRVLTPHQAKTNEGFINLASEYVPQKDSFRTSLLYLGAWELPWAHREPQECPAPESNLGYYIM